MRGLLTLFSFIYRQVKIAPNKVKLASYTTPLESGSVHVRGTALTLRGSGVPLPLSSGHGCGCQGAWVREEEGGCGRDEGG